MSARYLVYIWHAGYFRSFSFGGWCVVRRLGGGTRRVSTLRTGQVLALMYVIIFLSCSLRIKHPPAPRIPPHIRLLRPYEASLGSSVLHSSKCIGYLPVKPSHIQFYLDILLELSYGHNGRGHHGSYANGRTWLRWSAILLMKLCNAYVVRSQLSSSYLTRRRSVGLLKSPFFNLMANLRQLSGRPTSAFDLGGNAGTQEVVTQTNSPRGPECILDLPAVLYGGYFLPRRV